MALYTSRGTPRADLAGAFMQYIMDAKSFAVMQALPIQRVNKRTASVAVIGRAAGLAAYDVKRAANGNFNRVQTELTDMTYSCLSHGLEERVSDAQRKEYDDVELELAALKTIVGGILRRIEITGAAALHNTTTWTGATLYTDVSSAPWDAVGSDAIGHVMAAREKVRALTGMFPDTMLIGPVTMKNLLANTAIRASVQYTKMPTMQQLVSTLPSILGLNEIIVGKEIYNSSTVRDTTTGADIWSDDYALVFLKGAAGDPTSPGVGKSYVWNTSGTSDDMGVEVQTYREEQSKSDVVQAELWLDPKIIDASYGHLLKVDA